jgi:predicted Rossmann fold flavoprotein
MAAAQAALRGYAVTVIERNERPARKVMITGKGRCNVTNDCNRDTFLANVPENARFLYSAYSRFSPQDVMAFFEECGVPLKVERGNRVFPVSDKAVDIVDALVRYARDAGVRFMHGRAVRLDIRDGVCCGVELEDGRRFDAYAVIVCTGGASYPQTGSTGDGYVLARQAGHTIIPLRPSLVPLVSSDTWCREMQGLSLRNCGCRVTDEQTGRCIYEDLGEMLFTHFGVSGPMVLSASAHMRDMQPGRYVLHIDWKPGLSEEQLDRRIVQDLTMFRNCDFANGLVKLLPHKAIPVIVRLSGIPADCKCHSVTKQQRHALVRLLKDHAVRIEDFRPISEAIVTAGGVSTAEINAGTMESKMVSGLYFAGEVLDLDAYTGGFNLQIAFSTGFAAGTAV